MKKIAVVMTSTVIGKALALICTGIADANAIAPKDADVIITDKPEVMMEHLAAGKRVAQFITRNESPLIGLKETYGDKFGVFNVLSGDPTDSIPALFAFLGQE